MKKMSKTVVFFGSGPVAAASLRFLVNHFDIEAVITKSSTLSDMKQIVDSNTSVFTVQDRQELDILIASKKFSSRLGIIVDFGVIVSKNVIDSFELGIVNSHFSLLPSWRGADPISFAILHGDKKTGVSLMLINPSLDTGKLLTQKSLLIEPDDTTPSLTQRLVDLSNQLLAKYIPLYLSCKIKPHEQPHPDRASHSRKLTKEDGMVDWDKSAEKIEREVRAFLGWPGSRTSLGGKEVIITKASVGPRSDHQPGDLITDKQSGSLAVATADGRLQVERLKPAGKNEMSAAEFMRGYLR